MSKKIFKKEDRTNLSDLEHENKLTIMQLKVIIEDLNKKIINDMENINNIIDTNKDKLTIFDKEEISNLIENISSPTYLLHLKIGNSIKNIPHPEYLLKLK